MKMVFVLVGEEAASVAEALRMRLGVLDAMRQTLGIDERIEAERWRTARLMLRIAGTSKGIERRSGRPASDSPSASGQSEAVKSPAPVGPRSGRRLPPFASASSDPAAETGPTGREALPTGDAPPHCTDATGADHA